MFEWNWMLKLSLIGVGISLLGAIWMVVRWLGHNDLKGIWLFGLAALFFVALVTSIGSQIARLSFGP